MQKRIEKWLCHRLARPLAWTIYGICVGTMFVWSRGAKCIRGTRERWKAWRGKPVSQEPTKRISRREVAQR